MQNAIQKSPLRRFHHTKEQCQKLFSNRAHGGILRKKRKGRGKRFVSDRHSVHMVLRSSRAEGAWCFCRKENRLKLRNIIEKFSVKNDVEVHSWTPANGHIHLHLKFSSKRAYKAFVRAVTSAIAMAITGVSRWNKNALNPSEWDEVQRRSFWDHRPFTKIVFGVKYFLALKDYIEINKIEGFGFSKNTARWIFKNKEYARFKVLEQMNV